MKQPTLSDMTAFLQIAEHLNFRRAAIALGVSPSALSHTLRSFEARLGTRLLNRTTRSVALTDAGVRLASRLRPAITSIDQALHELAEGGDGLTGRISINTMEFGGRLLIADAVTEFQAIHPEVEFEICVEHALVDLVASGSDVGVRLRDDVPPDMIAIPIGPTVAMVACASPGFLQGRPLPREPADLPASLCIKQRLATGAIYKWEFEQDGRTIAIEPRGSLTCNNLAIIVAAALHGQGICFVPSSQVRPFLETGELVQVLEEYSPPFDGHCLYYPMARHQTRAFTSFIQHVRARYRPFAALIGTEGTNGERHRAGPAKG